jgi:hypothetical protein
VRIISWAHAFVVLGPSDSSLALQPAEPLFLCVLLVFRVTPRLVGPVVVCSIPRCHMLESDHFLDRLLCYKKRRAKRKRKTRDNASSNSGC